MDLPPRFFTPGGKVLTAQLISASVLYELVTRRTQKLVPRRLMIGFTPLPPGSRPAANHARSLTTLCSSSIRFTGELWRFALGFQIPPSPVLRVPHNGRVLSCAHSFAHRANFKLLPSNASFCTPLRACPPLRPKQPTDYYDHLCLTPTKSRI